jgi:polysaccharide export outer membrane protein
MEMNAPRHRVLGAALLACACSSVDGINNRAIQASAADPEPTPSPGLPPWQEQKRTEYRLGAQDLLEIEIFELEEPNKSKVVKTRVSQDGFIVLPLVGQVRAGNKTTAQLQSAIEAALGQDYLVHPSVSVLVAEYQARRVTVLGAVKTPGTFTLMRNSTTVLDVLALAGGVNEHAGSAIYVMRSPGTEALGAEDSATADFSAPAPGEGDPRAAAPAEASTPPSVRRVLKVDLVDLVERGNLEGNVPLEDGDVVHVAPSEQIFVMGEVNRGGSFPLRGDNITILRAIALAQGVKTDTDPSNTVLYRKTKDGRVTIPIDLDEIEAGSDKDLPMQADDVLVIGESAGGRFLRTLGSVFRGLFHVGYNLR